MPFKTKRRKIAASVRRISVSESGTLSYTGSVNNSTTTGSEANKNRQKFAVSSGFGGNEVRGEIIRIALLASLIIGLQIAIKVSNIPLTG